MISVGIKSHLLAHLTSSSTKLCITSASVLYLVLHLVTSPQKTFIGLSGHIKQHGRYRSVPLKDQAFLAIKGCKNFQRGSSAVSGGGMKRNSMCEINLHEEKSCVSLQICVSLLPGSFLFPGTTQVLSKTKKTGGKL